MHILTQRLNRVGFLFTFLIFSVIVFLVNFLMNWFMGGAIQSHLQYILEKPVAITVSVTVLFFFFSIIRARLHDLNHSGWWAGMYVPILFGILNYYYLPAVCTLILFVSLTPLLFKKGSDNANTYGEPPVLSKFLKVTFFCIVLIPVIFSSIFFYFYPPKEISRGGGIFIPNEQFEVCRGFYLETFNATAVDGGAGGYCFGKVETVTGPATLTQ